MEKVKEVDMRKVNVKIGRCGSVPQFQSTYADSITKAKPLEQPADGKKRYKNGSSVAFGFLKDQMQSEA